jgi:hypothetical protein
MRLCFNLQKRAQADLAATKTAEILDLGWLPERPREPSRSLSPVAPRHILQRRAIFLASGALRKPRGKPCIAVGDA